MHRTTLSLGLALMFLTACSRAQDGTEAAEEAAGPTLQVVCGERSFELTHEDDAQKIQDVIVGVVKELWYEMPSGGEVEFHILGSRALDFGRDALDTANERAPDRKRITSMSAGLTTRRTPYRVFKDLDGSSGIEEAVDEPTGPELEAGPTVGWAEIEENVRERIFPVVVLESMLLGR